MFYYKNILIIIFFIYYFLKCYDAPLEPRPFLVDAPPYIFFLKFEAERTLSIFQFFWRSSVAARAFQD